MGCFWESNFEFTNEQRLELLSIIGISPAEGDQLLVSLQEPVRLSRNDCSKRMTRTEAAKRLRIMRSLAQKLSKIWPQDSEIDMLLERGFHGARVPIPIAVAETMIPILDDIAIACTRTLKELDVFFAKPRRGRRTNLDAAFVALALADSWQDAWGERAPRGKMLKALRYAMSAAEISGDARRALELVLPRAKKQRGRVRRKARKPSPRPQGIQINSETLAK